MALHYGNTDISKIYFGTSEVSKIYYGNTLIYEVGETPPTPTDIDDFIEIGMPTGAYENEYVTTLKGGLGFCNVTSVSLPNLEQIVINGSADSQPFVQCPYLTTLYIGTNKQSICTVTLNGYAYTLPNTIQTIYVPSALESAYKADSWWSTYSSKIVGV